MSKKVLVAMSGGVDSSAAAAMLIDKGYEVAGATMKLWENDDYFHSENDETAACIDARRVAGELGIKHYVFDLCEDFRREVVNPFVAEYQAGHTPNPCVFCNKKLKFGALFEKALEMGFDYVSTGHYADVEQGNDGIFRLKCDPSPKDQTYVLYNMNQRILSHLLLPVGGDKNEIREYVRKKGLSVADSPDSQDICFIPDGDYVSLLKKFGVKSPEGEFTDMSGSVIGQHKGIINYTVGQRKGLGAFGSPKFVVAMDGGKNQIILGENSDLFSSQLSCRNVNWLSGSAPDSPIDAGVKIRYAAKACAATVYPGENNTARVEFSSPQRAITPGQSAVFYRDGYLIGGGIII